MYSLAAKYICSISGTKLHNYVQFSSVRLLSVCGSSFHQSNIFQQYLKQFPQPGNFDSYFQIPSRLCIVRHSSNTSFQIPLINVFPFQKQKVVVVESDTIQHEAMKELNMKSKYIVNSRGNKIACYKSFPKNGSKPKASVLIVHGYGEYFLFHEHIIKAFQTSNNYAIYGQDLEGHGFSGGSRGLLAKVEHNVSDIHQHISEIRKENPDQPLYVVGISMGGGLTLAAAINNPTAIDGAVVHSPYVMFHPKSAKKKRAYLVLLIDHVFPNMPITRDTFNVNKLARCEEIKKKIANDSLMWKKSVKSGTAANCIRLGKYMTENRMKIQIPFLVLHGDKDIVNLIEGSERVVSSAISKDKELKIYKDATHLLLNEVPSIRHHVIQDTLSWIHKRTEAFYK